MTDRELDKILCVEDETDIQTIIKFSLEKRGGYNVLGCTSGLEALDVVEGFGPDLILLDVMMPEMDGVTLFKKLRQLPATRSTPIIFITAKSQVSEIKSYKQLGAIDVITKPFSASMLAEEIKSIWDNYTNKS
jgi:CheY-like chemotaxis protein